MPRTRKSAAMIAARNARRRRSSQRGLDISWQVYKICELCGRDYCANNYPDRKVRLVRWKIFIICARCRYELIPTIKRLMDDNVLRFTKSFQRKLDDN